MAQPVSLATVQAVITKALQRWPEHKARIERSAALIALGNVEHVGDTTYLVRSQTDPSMRYAVAPDTCACTDRLRKPERRCKHEWAVRILLEAERIESCASVTRQAADFAAFDVIAAAERIAAGVA
jgi:hypothetical protein